MIDEVSRFDTRAMSLREMIWQARAARGDAQALADLLNARLTDKTLDLLELSGDQLIEAVKEMSAAVALGAEIDKALVSIAVM